MRHTLIFNLPDDRYDLKCAENGAAYRSILDDFLQFLRNKIKHQEKQETTFDEIREELFLIIKEHDEGILD